jgi:hypothetical protein
MNREEVIQNIMADKDLRKNILTKGSGIDSFIENAQDYISAIHQGRMLCVIHSVSSSGMSRNLSFYSCEVDRYGQYYYRNYRGLFRSLGYKEAKEGFRINGCGMDMVFHTNYSNIHTFRQIGLLTAEECGSLSQKTPPVL